MDFLRPCLSKNVWVVFPSSNKGRLRERDVCFHLVLTGLVQYVQGLHGHGLAVVVQLCDQQLHAPATEELHVRPQQHAEVFGGVQPAWLLSKMGSIVGWGWGVDIRLTHSENLNYLNLWACESAFPVSGCFVSFLHQ